MPNSPSAKKRFRQTIKRTEQNRAVRSAVRNQVKKLRGMIAAGDVANCQTELRVTARKLDRASSRGVIHANTASRVKSRLARAVRNLALGAKSA